MEIEWSEMKWVIGAIILVGAFVGLVAWGSGGGSSGLSAKASHILVNSEAEVDKLLAQFESLKDGSEEQATLFGELAKEHSKCPSGKSLGALGSFGRGMMVPEFDHVVFEEPVGVIHKVKTQFGWHLVLTTFRTEPAVEDKKEL